MCRLLILFGLRVLSCRSERGRDGDGYELTTCSPSSGAAVVLTSSSAIMSDASFEPESSSSEGKLLTELKVTELRSELEKRGKDKNGVKATLTDRLSEVSSPFRCSTKIVLTHICLFRQALEEEGHDPSSYLFTVTSEATPVKGSAAKRKSGNPSSKCHFLIQPPF